MEPGHVCVINSGHVGLGCLDRASLIRAQDIYKRYRHM